MDDAVRKALGQIPEDARLHLIPILGEAVNTLENLDLVCPQGHADCKKLVAWQGLYDLLQVLNQPDSAG